MIEFREIEPDIRLAHLIDRYWISAGDILGEAVEFRILPDCCTDIILNIGDSVISSNMNKHRSYLIGASTKFSEISIKGSVRMIGIRFKPLGLKAFASNYHLAEIKNLMIEVSGFNADNIFQGKIPSTQNIKEYLDSYLLKKLCLSFTANIYVAGAVQLITQRQGIIKITALCEYINTSERNLERLFAANVGLSPKEFARITKLMHVKKTLHRNPEKDLGQIAFDFDYYDHAHFTKDFIEFAGVAPSAYGEVNF